MKIIFATGNEGKMREIRAILGDMEMQVYSMKEAGLAPDIEENGTTFEENALIKAYAVAEALAGQDGARECVVMADDSGLEIDYLNGEPGVYSARYLGEETPFSEKSADLLRRLKDVPEEKRTARFVCAIASVFPGGEEASARGTIEGRIGYELRGDNGFGYDPIFYLPEYGCTAAELPDEEKEPDQPQMQGFGTNESGTKEKDVTIDMKILIVSDSHRYNVNLLAVLERTGPYDMLIHCGDVEGSEYTISEAAGCPVVMVQGNNDFFSSLPREEEFMIGRYKVWVTHGHHYYIAMNTETIKQEAVSREVDIVMCGHSHKPVIDIGKDVTLINPGSISYPRQDNRKPSYIIMELDREGEAHYTLNFI